MRRFLGYVFGANRIRDEAREARAEPPPQDALLEWCWLGTDDEKTRQLRARRIEENERCQRARSGERSIQSSRKELLGAADELLNRELPTKDRELVRRSTLDAPRRSKVVGDAMRLHSNELETIVRRWAEERGDALLPASKEEVERVLRDWREEKYAKNVVGEAVSFGAHASAAAEIHGGLTARVAAETAWAMQQSLLQACAQFSTGDLRRRVAENVRRRILPSVVRLWTQTEKASRGSAPRSGIVVERWRREEEEKRKLDRGRRPDAKFQVVPYVAPVADLERSRRFLGLKSKIANAVRFAKN